MFVSLLFSGSISDNQICKDSGFYSLLKELKSNGSIQDGDAIMADKGFRIENELSEIHTQLNIPPFATAQSQMIAGDEGLPHTGSTLKELSTGSKTLS
jgi:hypothetical protein